ncbi:MAG: tetratricopeptide repeat protein [Bryobacteraceae bacterium]
MKGPAGTKALASSGRGLSGIRRLGVSTLAGTALALLAISVVGQIARAQEAPPTAARPGLTAAPVQTAVATRDETRTALAAARRDISPEELGDLMMLHRRYREAVESYAQGPANDASLRNKIGIAYHQWGQLENARKAYLQALRLRPAFMEAANNLGTVEYCKKNYRRAISWYRKALGMEEPDSPQTASVLMNLGMAWFARKKYEKANLSFQTALRLDPNVFEHRGTVGQILEDRNVEERSRFHFYLAKLYARQGRNELAIQYLRKSLEEGYKDRKAPWSQDSDFATLRQMPEFQQLVAVAPRVL